MGEETGSDAGKPTGVCLKTEGLPSPQNCLPDGDKVTLCAEATKEDLLQARTALAGLFSWMKAELCSHTVTRHIDATIGTDGPAPAPPPDPKTLALLRAYSDSLMEMIQKRLESSNPEML
ncbi:uncharacterized protein ACIBXB_006350 [Morphnus guianensis]